MEKSKNALDFLKELKKAKAEVKDTKASTGYSNYFDFYNREKKAQDLEKKIRFITDLKDAQLIKYHLKKAYPGDPLYNHPCLENFGKECPTCKIDKKPITMFGLTVYDYTNEFEPKRLLLTHLTMCQLLPDIDKMAGLVGDITTRDYNCVQEGVGKDKTFRFEPVEDSESFDKEVVPYTFEEMLEMMKNDSSPSFKNTFKLPEGVIFSELKDIGDEPKKDELPF